MLGMKDLTKFPCYASSCTNCRMFILCKQCASSYWCSCIVRGGSV